MLSCSLLYMWRKRGSNSDQFVETKEWRCLIVCCPPHHVSWVPVVYPCCAPALGTNKTCYLTFPQSMSLYPTTKDILYSGRGQAQGWAIVQVVLIPVPLVIIRQAARTCLLLPLSPCAGICRANVVTSCFHVAILFPCLSPVLGSHRHMNLIG